MFGRIFPNAGVLGLFNSEDQYEWIRLKKAGKNDKANQMLWADGCDKITLSYDKLNITYDKWIVSQKLHDTYVVYPFTVDPTSDMLKSKDIIYDPIKISYWSKDLSDGIQTMWVMSAYPVLINTDVVEQVHYIFTDSYVCDSKMLGHICSRQPV